MYDPQDSSIRALMTPSGLTPTTNDPVTDCARYLRQVTRIMQATQDLPPGTFRGQVMRAIKAEQARIMQIIEDNR